MSVSKHTNQQVSGESAAKVLGSKGAGGRKVPGTRAGTVEDWRAAGAKNSGEKSARGKIVRDGR